MSFSRSRGFDPEGTLSLLRRISHPAKGVVYIRNGHAVDPWQGKGYEWAMMGRVEPNV